MALQIHCWIAGIYVLTVLICSGVADSIRTKRAPCVQTTCPAGSRCVDDATSSGSRCQCYPGYIPPSCVDRDECSLVKTLCHNGTCHNTPGSFRCLCSDGYTGERCTKDADECESSPCLNNNTCINTPGSYHCQCYSGYLPPDCRDLDECAVAKNLCSNGTCVNTHGSYRCNCHYGYTGSHCRHRDPCAISPCQNGGTCTSGQDGDTYSCRCYVGFNRSNNCEDIDECQLSSKICFHGNCVNTPGSFKCVCEKGYSGLHCQDQIDYCQPAPCLNGGTCIGQQGGYKCNCFEGFNNTANCIDINECRLDPHFCLHGSCMNTLGSFKCDCNPGYQGQRCTDDTDECQSSPCIHGACVNMAGSFSCSCFGGYYGKTCSDVSTTTLPSTMSPSSTLISSTMALSYGSVTTSTTERQQTDRHSKTSTYSSTVKSTVSQQSGISAQSNASGKSWISSNFWVVVIVVSFVIGLGVGAGVFGYKKRRLMISYKTLGNNSTPSSPISPSNGFHDNPLYDQIHSTVHNDGSTTLTSSISIISNTDENRAHFNKVDDVSLKETNFNNRPNTTDDSVRSPAYDSYSGYDAGISET